MHWAARHQPWLWENPFGEGSRGKGNELYGQAPTEPVSPPIKLQWTTFLAALYGLRVTRGLRQDPDWWAALSLSETDCSFKYTSTVSLVSPLLSLFPHQSNWDVATQRISVPDSSLATHPFFCFSPHPTPIWLPGLAQRSGINGNTFLFCLGPYEDSNCSCPALRLS